MRRKMNCGIHLRFSENHDRIVTSREENRRIFARIIRAPLTRAGVWRGSSPSLAPTSGKLRLVIDRITADIGLLLLVT